MQERGQDAAVWEISVGDDNLKGGQGGLSGVVMGEHKKEVPLSAGRLLRGKIKFSMEMLCTARGLLHRVAT